VSQAVRTNQAVDAGGDIDTRQLLLTALKLLLVLVVVAGLYWGGKELYQRFDVPIAVIGVDGDLTRVKPQELEGIVATSLGGGFLSLKLENVCAALEAHPWIATASAHRKWPNEVVIAVTEEAPIARWGEEQFLNTKGEVGDIAGGDIPDNLPQLAGPAGMERRVMQQYKNFTQVLAPMGLNIEKCQLATRGNWLLTFDNGMELAVGKEPVVDKLNRFQRVWETELEQRADHIARVDIRYGNGVAVKWKENAAPAGGGGK